MSYQIKPDYNRNNYLPHCVHSSQKQSLVSEEYFIAKKQNDAIRSRSEKSNQSSPKFQQQKEIDKYVALTLKDNPFTFTNKDKLNEILEKYNEELDFQDLIKERLMQEDSTILKDKKIITYEQ